MGQSLAIWTKVLAVVFSSAFVVSTDHATSSAGAPTKPQSESVSKSLSPLRLCLLVEPSPLTYVSGYANRYQALLQYLHDHQATDSVALVTAEVVDPHPPSHWSGGQVPVHYTAGVRLPYYPLMSLVMDWTLKIPRVLYRHRPDLIHASSPGFMVLSAVIWSRLWGIPLVLSYHTHLPVYVRSYLQSAVLSRIAEWIVWKLIRLVHSCADLTLVTSPQILEEFQQNYVPNCQVWQKGIDTERFHPRWTSPRMRERMTTPGHENDFLMVYVGRLGTEKRLEDLRAVLENTPPNVRLCLVGTGPHETRLRQWFGVMSENDSNQESRCVFLGQLTGEPLSQAFASADVFVMPSDSETLGFVVLESMASGVPVIGVQAGGIPDLIDDGVTGYLVPPGDTGAFVDRLGRLQGDKALRMEMSARGRLEMEQWSWTASMSKLRLEQYPQALANFHNRWEQRLWRFLTLQGRKDAGN